MHIKNKLGHPQVDIREDKRYLEIKNKIEHSSETLSTPLQPYESARGRLLVGGYLSIIVVPPKEKGIGEKSQLFHLILSLANKRGLPLSDTPARRFPIGQ